jgi:hypothetical protein
MAITIANPPEAKPERISRLITRIEGGDIKIPKFQRGFIWTREQILDLLDSIYRGYPIGSLLLWLTNEKLARERNIGGFHLPDTPEEYPTNYILDGQQRITTIYGVLRGTATGTSSDLNVYFDLNEKQFLHPVDTPTRTQMPMNILFRTRQFRQFQQFLASLEDGDALVEESDRVSETFREYAVPVITVTEADTTQVSRIFERINSTGTKLTVFDLMVAATWSEDFDLNDHVDQIVTELEEKDFGELDKVTILRALSTCAHTSAKRDSILRLRKLSRAELASEMENTKEALRKAVDFLSTEVSVISDAFLPYERQLVLLAFVMSQSHDVDPAAVDILRRWFWRTSFSERYRRGGEGLFDTDLEVTVAALSNPDKLPHFGREVDADQFITTEFRKTSAFSNAFVALLASRSPKNLTNGATIDIGTALSAYNRKEFHHIFPQAYLKSRAISRQRINSIANICMLSSEQNKAISDKEPAGYFAQVKHKLGDNLEAVLASNLIPSAAVPLIENNDYDGFLQTRASHLAETVNSVI